MTEVTTIRKIVMAAPLAIIPSAPFNQPKSSA